MMRTQSLYTVDSANIDYDRAAVSFEFHLWLSPGAKISEPVATGRYCVRAVAASSLRESCGDERCHEAVSNLETEALIP
jgi:hypothetical protein